MSEQNKEVEFEPSEKSIRWLASAIRLRNYLVPKHQRRAGVWNEKVKREFIDSLRKGHPCPLLLIYKDEDGISWLEDGLQRVTALQTFINNEYVDSYGKKFSEWTEFERRVFELKKLPITIYSNADQATRITIFDRFQNGSPLKPGERLNSLGDTILVDTTFRLLYISFDDNGNEVAGEYFNRLENVLGKIRRGIKADKRYTQLLEFVALMNGIAHGFSKIKEGKRSGISKKYDDLRPYLMEDIDEVKVKQIIEKLLYVFEEAKRIYSTDETFKLNTFRNPGNFIGPIIYSIIMAPNEWETIKNKWIKIIVDFSKTNKDLTKTFIYNEETGLLRGISKARSWNNTRWVTICNNVGIVVPLPIITEDETESESESENGEE